MSLNTYTKHFNTKVTPQSQPIPGSNMVPNSAGGFTFEVSDWTKFDRFLILGTEGGSYYANEQKLTKQNAEAVLRCIKADGLKAVARIVEVSDKGLAPKNDQAIFALAMALKLGNTETKRAAAEAVPSVCRIGTHIFQLAEAVKAFGGWGRVTARAFANWYNKQDADKLALNLLKYQNRNGWSHKDLLAKAHVGLGATDDAHKALYSYVSRGGDLSARKVERKKGDKLFSVGDYAAHSRDVLPRIVEGFEKVRAATTATEVAKLVTEYGLPREFLPTEHLNSTAVWDALLHAGKFGMPLTAMVRNLGKMSSIGLVTPGSEAAKFVVSKLKDEQAIKHARVHPMALLIAQRIYAQGHGEKGSLSWASVKPVVDALDGAFYLAFKSVVPTGKRWLLALDVSGSMSGGQVAGSPLTPRDASAAMALVTANVEADYDVVGFTQGSGSFGRGASMHYGYEAGISPIDISARMRLNDAIAKVSNLPFGGTDCALPMLYAKAKKLKFDAFVVYTDSETWAGSIQPVQALRQYRDEMGIDAKLIVCGMVSNGFTIADPNDPGMLDVVGFSADTPQVMSSFVGDKI